MSGIRWQDLSEAEREDLRFLVTNPQGIIWKGRQISLAAKGLIVANGIDSELTAAGRALVESAASDEATDAQMQADAKAVREFVEQQHQQRETIRQQAAEIERLKASNAELRACADEAQAARLAAVAEAAAMRRAIETWRTIGTDDDHYSHDELEVIIDDLAKSVNGNAGAALRERLAAAESRVKALEAALWAFAIWWDKVVSQPTNTYMRPNEYWPSHEEIKAAADALKGDME